MKNIRIYQTLVIWCIFLIASGLPGCKHQSGQGEGGDSKITLLCSGNERMAFASRPDTNNLVFLPLVDKHDIGQPQPRLLERWEASDDKKEWTFFLRKDVAWEDGEPVTSHDVKFTLELYTGPELLYERKVFDEIIIVDDYICRLRASKPFYGLLYATFGILPSHLLKDLDRAKYHSWNFWSRPVGNGPYRYVRHIPDTMVELEANPDYYGPRPKIKQVVLKFGGNSLTELLSGNADAVNGLNPIEIHQFNNESRFNIYHEFDVTDVLSILWNHNNSLFEDPSVRRALTLALNRKELCQILNFPEETPVFDVAITTFQFSRGEVPAPLPYDPQKAADLLDEAGWLETEKGALREKEGRKFRFSLLFSAEFMPMAVYIQEQFRRVGVEMETVTMESSVLAGRVREGKFDAFLHIFNPFGGGWEYVGYDNPELGRLQESVFTVTSPEEFDSLAKNMRPIFYADVPCTFLLPSVTFHVVHSRIKGLKSPNLSDPIKFIEQIWIGE